MTFKQWAIDTSERAITTYIQSFLAFAVSWTALDASVVKSAALASLPVLFNVLYQAVFGWKPPTISSWYLDTFLRSSRVFAYTVLGLMASDLFNFLDVSFYEAAAKAGIAAVFVVLKTSFATLRKNTVTPGSLVKAA